MTSFRSPDNQAKHLVIKKVMHGRSRHGLQKEQLGFISSVSTENKYRGNVKRFLEWLQSRKMSSKDVTEQTATEFLNHISERCVQKTIDGYRQAFDIVFSMKLPYVVSEISSFLLPRAYRIEQIEMLAQCATEGMNLPILICAHGGLRASELDTISRPDEIDEDHRAWLEERFYGREEEIEYVVIGKGGLRRKIRLSPELSAKLEKTRLEMPIIKRQRGINYTKRYSLIGGHSFSLKFSRLSQDLLGWSTGGHGLRHHYAKRRMITLQSAGFFYDDALRIVSQELGHFSTANTLTYMR